MEALVNAISEFLAAVLSRFGYVGLSRRRAGLRDDVGLITELRESPDFGTGSDAYRYLSRHITSEVASYSSVTLDGKKVRKWTSILLSFGLGVPLAYWTYTIVDDGFDWYAISPGFVGGLFLIAALGMLAEAEVVERSRPSARSQPPVSRGRCLIGNDASSRFDIRLPAVVEPPSGERSGRAQSGRRQPVDDDLRNERPAGSEDRSGHKRCRVCAGDA